MGSVVQFPTEYARKRASIRREEPAPVIVLPVLRIERPEAKVKTNLPVPLGGAPCKS